MSCALSTLGKRRDKRTFLLISTYGAEWRPWNDPKSHPTACIIAKL